VATVAGAQMGVAHGRVVFGHVSGLGCEVPLVISNRIRKERPGSGSILTFMSSTEYFTNGPIGPRDAARCSDNACDCSSLPLDRGQGFLYVSSEAVDFRRDALSLEAAQAKLERLAQDIGADQLTMDPVLWTGIIVCESAARRRKLDLAMAAADAELWWETGEMPLYPTPEASEKETSEEPLPDLFAIAERARARNAPRHEPATFFDPSLSVEELYERIIEALRSNTEASVVARLMHESGNSLEDCQKLVAYARLSRDPEWLSRNDPYSTLRSRERIDQLLKENLRRPIDPVQALDPGWWRA